MRTGNKMLFCSPRIKIPAYQQPPAVAVLPWRCRFVPVQELVFAGCFFRFAPYGRALVWAQCGCMPHKPKGTDQTAKCGKMLPIKRKQGEKCYFSPCALISKSYHQLLSTRFRATLRAICVSSPTTYPPAVYHWDTAPTRAPWLKTPNG